MTAYEIRKKFLAFYEKQGHAIIPSSPLVPENDPTTLFISSGMQPLVPYLLGQPHPLGKRIANSQKSFRAQDIEEVGDNRHTTFFEMLGNWSLGDYFKKEQLPWVFAFLTQALGLDPKRLYVSVFEGNEYVPKDEESIGIWKTLFAQKNIEANIGERIFIYPAKKNWWSRSGEPEKMAAGEPGGPDSEIFYDFGESLKLHEQSPYKNEPCHPNCDCGRFMEIGNSVFMQYQKQSDGSLKELPNKNVDFGGGLERLVAAANNTPDIFLTDIFSPLINIIEQVTKAKYDIDSNKPAIRIIADHMKAATFMIAEGVVPSNKQQGYVLRRLIRRSSVKMYYLGGGLTPLSGLKMICDEVLRMYDMYFDVGRDSLIIESVINDEMEKFGNSLDRGLKVFEKTPQDSLNTLLAFDLFQTYGFPLEVTEELLRQKNKEVDKEEFNEIFKSHQELSRKAASGMFKGGLADHSVETTKLHTATHLLHKALRIVLGDHVSQKGSNITVERLRFDFSHTTKLTPEEVQKVEDLVNEQIQKNIKVTMNEMDKEEALKSGALGFFVEKYGDRVKVYTIGEFSREICGGPHVNFTGALGHFTIIKEESAASGIRRIYAKVQGHEIV